MSTQPHPNDADKEWARQALDRHGPPPPELTTLLRRLRARAENTRRTA